MINMGLTTEKKTMTIIVVFSIIIVSITAFVIFPTLKDIKQTKDTVTNLYNYLQKRYSRVASIMASLGQLEQIKQATSEFPNYLFAKNDELTLITDLEDLANRERVSSTIISSNFDNVTNNKLLINLSVNGPYQNIVHYVSSLEKFSYFLTIEELQLTPLVDRSDPTAPPVNTTLNLKLGLYVN